MQRTGPRALLHKRMRARKRRCRPSAMQYRRRVRYLRTIMEPHRSTTTTLCHELQRGHGEARHGRRRRRRHGHCGAQAASNSTEAATSTIHLLAEPGSRHRKAAARRRPVHLLQRLMPTWLLDAMKSETVSDDRRRAREWLGLARLQQGDRCLASSRPRAPTRTRSRATTGLIPLFGMVWEHARYLDYKNRAARLGRHLGHRELERCLAACSPAAVPRGRV